MSGKLDSEFYETVIAYNMLTDEPYLASIIDHLQQKYFENKDIANIVGLITDFYSKRSAAPTLTEIKSYLTDENMKKSFRVVVSMFDNFDKNFNRSELYENTEKFLKEKAVYHTLLEVADQTDKEVDTSEILSKFEKACGVTLSTDIGLDYFNELDRHITDLTTVDSTISSGWSWLDEKLDGGFLENGRAIYVFAGETNIGKSIFLGNIARNIADQGKTVLLVSLEMSEQIGRAHV